MDFPMIRRVLLSTAAIAFSLTFANPSIAETFVKVGTAAGGAFDIAARLLAPYLEKHLGDGHHVILEIDWQGAQQVRATMPDCITVFILPPSREELDRRLRSRGTDTDEVIERRLRDALSDMSHWDEFDYVIFNDDLDQAVADLEAVLADRGTSSATTNPAVGEAANKLLA